MKKNKYILISLAVLCGALVIAFIINILFKIESYEILAAEWSAGDALNYVGTMIGATSTFVLSLIAYKQNEKLQALEDNNYVASNSCMVLIDKIQVKPKASIPVNYEWHTEQILSENDNNDKYPSGYEIIVTLKKVDEVIQATPSLIFVRKCTLFLSDKDGGDLGTAIWTENVRDGYTRVAIKKSGISFTCTMLVSRNKQTEFEKDIQTVKNRLTIEFEFDIVTDKYVATKCKCRACCNYQNNNGIVTWDGSDNAMVFFYGHELKSVHDIYVLTGE